MINLRPVLLWLLCAVGAQCVWAADFDRAFRDTTLRLDYVFTADPTGGRGIALRNIHSDGAWAGRRVNMTRPLYQADGVMTMTDRESGDTLYTTTFSTLYHEWLCTPDAGVTPRAMEHTVQVPMPRRPVQIDVRLYDNRRELMAQASHPLDPDDILIRPLHRNPEVEVIDLHIGGSPESVIDVAILGEGYTSAERDTFVNQARRAVESILAHSPFGDMASRFSFRAVMIPSADSGVSVPRLGQWVDTPFGSHFSTFYSDRYLTSPRPSAMHDALAGIPYEHIIVLANTPEYGGGGILNAYTLTAGSHPLMPPVVVHEFGHSFGGLADEYFYEGDIMEETYPHDVEPWAPNLTTLTDFGHKWEDMLPAATPVPTPAERAADYPVGVYEGGGYSFKGVYRPADRCRMRDNTYPTFCPVCRRALESVIRYYTEQL